jgi:ABC-type nickel/cobalt efflux system permease component RcnA
MKYLLIIGLVFLMVFATGCDTELGHSDEEDHDHDGDGEQDHASDEHDEDYDDEEHDDEEIHTE